MATHTCTHAAFQSSAVHNNWLVEYLKYTHLGLIYKISSYCTYPYKHFDLCLIMWAILYIARVSHSNLAGILSSNDTPMASYNILKCL